MTIFIILVSLCIFIFAVCLNHICFIKYKIRLEEITDEIKNILDERKQLIKMNEYLDKEISKCEKELSLLRDKANGKK